MKINKIIIATIFLFTCIGIFSACEYNVEEELIAIENPDDSDDDNDDDNDSPAAAATFSADVKPIIDGRCVQCHNGNQFPDLRTYDGVKNNATIVKNEVASKSMPQGSSLTNAQIQTIVSWVEDGAQNN